VHHRTKVPLFQPCVSSQHFLNFLSMKYHQVLYVEKTGASHYQCHHGPYE
jgi:hypothetical protein